MPRRDNHASHDQENHERWLISYSDFITLLFAFFVVMYSISSVNEGKYKVLSQTLIGAFDVPEKPPSSSDPVDLSDYANNSFIDLTEQSNRDGEWTDNSENEAGTQQSQLNQLSDQVESAFADLIEDRDIAINGNETWVEISLSSSLLFDSGSAQPNSRALPILQEVAGILSGYENPVHVEGFTDNVPINSELYRSNWELSAARSATVVRLLASEGVDPERLAAVGYAEFQPIAANDSVEGRSENRRVVIVVSKDLGVRRSVTGIDGIDKEQDRELELGKENLDQSSFLKEKNRVKAVELEGGGMLFTQDDKK